MSDLLGLDPARIERLRSPERLAYFDPERFWEVLPAPDGPIVDIGCGVGFLTLPFARRWPRTTVYGCDVLEGMVRLLAAEAREAGLANLEALVMAPAGVPLPDDTAALVCMAQVHHELDDPDALLAECRRVLRPGGCIAIADWKDEDNGKSPPAGRRVPAGTIRAQLVHAGFVQPASHDVYAFHALLTARVPA